MLEVPGGQHTLPTGSESDKYVGDAIVDFARTHSDAIVDFARTATGADGS